MQPTYTPPTPVIGNHPAGCSCSTCEGGRKRLLASPFVQRLISEMGVLHEHLYKATSTKQISAPELEKRVLELTDELANAQQGAQALQNALDESRKISQERERQLNGVQKQLRASEQNLSHFTSRATSAEAFLATVKEALDCKDPAKLAEKAQKLQGDLANTRTRLTASEREVSDLKTERKGYETGRRDIQVRLEAALLDLKESQEAGLALQQDLANVGEELRLAEQGRDKAISERGMVHGQYEAEFARATGHMQARTKLEEEISVLKSDKENLLKQLGLADQRIMQQVGLVEQRTFEGTLQTVVASVLVAVAAFLVGRWAR